MKSQLNHILHTEKQGRERKKAELFEFSCHANDSEYVRAASSSSRTVFFDSLCNTRIISTDRQIDYWYIYQYVCMYRLAMASTDMKTKMKLEKIKVTRNR